MLAFNRKGLRLREPTLDYLMQLYDAGVAYVDDRVGALLDALQASGRLEHSIVILTSDHGGEFQEHGELLHAQVFEEALRIPLLVSLPEMRGSTHASCREGSGSPTPGRASAATSGATRPAATSAVGRSRAR